MQPESRSAANSMAAPRRMTGIADDFTRDSPGSLRDTSRQMPCDISTKVFCRSKSGRGAACHHGAAPGGSANGIPEIMPRRCAEFGAGHGALFHGHDTCPRGRRSSCCGDCSHGRSTVRPGLVKLRQSQHLIVISSYAGKTCRGTSLRTAKKAPTDANFLISYTLLR